MRWIVVILALLVSTGCQNRRLIDLVREYDQALIQAYRELDSNKVKPYVTEDEHRRIWALIDLKRAARLVLESEMLSFKPVKVEKITDDIYKVTTEELWRWYDRPLDPGKEKGTTFEAKMIMEWEVVRDGDHFKINKGRTLSSEYLEPPGYKIEHVDHARKRAFPVTATTGSITTPAPATATTAPDK